MTGHADVVVVGGGHNGLVAAAYLAHAGLETMVCERRGVGWSGSRRYRPSARGAK